VFSAGERRVKYFAMIQLTHDSIDYTSLTESVRSNAAGAVVLFLGTVREMTNGRQTIALDYDAFPEMAKAKFEELIAEVRDKWPIVNAAIVHRLGRLELGEVSVAVAVSTPHREQAFEAGEHLIDRLKEIVPIWKKENWADGTTEWVHPGVQS
jgi:molybdopterin synthase catalytic subunit